MLTLDKGSGRIQQAEWQASPNYDAREQTTEPSAIIVHCISLPPGKYGNGCVIDFFQNRLDVSLDEYFKKIAQLTVSAHFFIDRLGVLTQLVSTNKRAWHAGDSYCLERGKVNDFSIGIELEGLDTDRSGFTDDQYTCLKSLIVALQQAYPAILPTHVFAHSDIAPERKPDPGPYFQWSRLYEK